MAHKEATETAPALLQRLMGIMAALRGEGGCPWDQAQTHGSLRPFLIEEAYEVLDAIDAGDMNGLQEELGDVLLQVVFHAQLAEETNHFTLAHVIATLNDKLIRRHPHVFGQDKAKDAADVAVIWRKAKEEERASAHVAQCAEPSLLDGIPRGLPALMQAEKVGVRAARVGFDWPDATAVWAKVNEELTELQQALAQRDNAPSKEADEHVAEELGDVLFALVNLGRHIDVTPELALRAATEKFTRRFHHMEKLARANGYSLSDCTPDEQEALWQEAKTQLSPGEA